ncbi:MAG: hypothetical protein E3J21_25075 [Anaerolineales bacterium]|nr:MAG: hypothetical protein E3J21_25075 [Anaerolineales bacterium]
MELTELSFEKLEEEIKGVKDFLIGELSPRVEKLARRHPLLLYSLRHPQLRLNSPIAVSLEDDGVQVIAAAYDLDVFGYGETEWEALDDLRHTITDLYFTLKDDARALGPMPRRVWEYLSDIIEESS